MSPALAGVNHMASLSGKELCIYMGFPGGSDGKESASNVGDLGLIAGWKGPLEEGISTDPSIPAWRIPMDRGVWQAVVHGVTKSQTQLTDSHTRCVIYLVLSFLA